MTNQTLSNSVIESGVILVFLSGDDSEIGSVSQSEGGRKQLDLRKAWDDWRQ
jgi:hypothetical protein